MLTRIVGIVGWIGTVLVFAGVAIRFLRPEWQQAWNWLLMGGLGCMVIYILGQWRDIANAFSRRNVQFGTIATASVAIVLTLLVGINYISNRQNKRWDLTAAKQYSLSDQTRKVLQSLTKPVKVRVFARETEFPNFRSRLDEYAYESKQVSVEYIDPDKDVATAQKHQIQAYNTVLFEYEGRTERVVGDSEQQLTNTLNRVVLGQQKKVYFVQGHGEKDTQSAEPREGINTVAAALGGDGFTVDKVVLAQRTDVPPDASVLVFAGPKSDLLPTEADLVRQYLAKGGKVVFLMDPPDRLEAPPLTNFAALLKEWGIELNNDVIVDLTNQRDPATPIAATYPNHAITEGFNRVLTAYPFARSVTPLTGTGGKMPQTFVETGPNSWAETDLKKLMGSGVRIEDREGDKQGPISLAVAVSAPAANAPESKDGGQKPETRVVAIGDSNFITNAVLGIQGNQDLFLNVVNWVAQQENLIAIRAKDPEDRRVNMTPDQQRWVFWLSVFIIPGMILGAGVRSWWRRR
jgi:ABC-type uncharacterized transport system involved in gliding motility auxiliary subunit